MLEERLVTMKTNTQYYIKKIINLGINVATPPIIGSVKFNPE